MSHESPAVEAVDDEGRYSTVNETWVAVDAVSEANDAEDVLTLLMLIHLEELNHPLPHQRVM